MPYQFCGAIIKQILFKKYIVAIYWQYFSVIVIYLVYKRKNIVLLNINFKILHLIILLIIIPVNGNFLVIIN